MLSFVEYLRCGRINFMSGDTKKKKKQNKTLCVHFRFVLEIKEDFRKEY